MSCEDCEGNCLSIFRWLRPDEFKSVDDVRAPQNFTNGQIIFSEGQVKHGIYCVRSGIVRVTKNSMTANKSITSGLATGGDILGTSTVENASHFPCTATAIDHVNVCYFTNAEIRQLANNVRILKGMLAVSQRHLEQSEKLVCNLISRSLREKFAFVLLDLAKRFGVRKGKEILIQARLSRSDLASLCGTVVESVARVLSEFEEDGHIRLERRKIFVLDTEKLHQISASQS